MTRRQWAELEIALCHQIIPTLDLDDPKVVETVDILYSNLLVDKELAEEAEAGERPEPPQPVGINPGAKYLTAREAAAYLGLTYGTFRHKAARIRRTRHGRYTREALDRFAELR